MYHWDVIDLTAPADDAVVGPEDPLPGSDYAMLLYRESELALRPVEQLALAQLTLVDRAISFLRVRLKKSQLTLDEFFRLFLDSPVHPYLKLWTVGYRHELKLEKEREDLDLALYIWNTIPSEERPEDYAERLNGIMEYEAILIHLQELERIRNKRVEERAKQPRSAIIWTP